ncbi:hypothetical protein [Macrococcoides caseolyticum]|uniref:Uncharacterized protein n=1 Tax=Macrococcoides caseolyticum TaxID=69966 RepID=A0ACC9MVP1_9STAP|nr:hypothetical protein [Macrococcus caseolyticus]PKE57520.1 hypothetical protein CW682_00180 [Macrococcus caseolyticus]
MEIIISIISLFISIVAIAISIRMYLVETSKNQINIRIEEIDNEVDEVDNMVLSSFTLVNDSNSIIILKKFVFRRDGHDIDWIDHEPTSTIYTKSLYGISIPTPRFAHYLYANVLEKDLNVLPYSKEQFAYYFDAPPSEVVVIYEARNKKHTVTIPAEFLIEP